VQPWRVRCEDGDDPVGAQRVGRTADERFVGRAVEMMHEVGDEDKVPLLSTQILSQRVTRPKDDAPAELLFREDRD